MYHGHVRRVRRVNASPQGASALVPDHDLHLHHTSVSIQRAVMALELPTPDTYPAFPFLPYEIQLSLMRHLYENIERRRVTVVESPTGTVRVSSFGSGYA